MSDKQFGHLSDGQVQEEIRRIEKRRALEHAEDLRKLMSELNGRRFIYWLVFEHCSVGESSVDLAIKDGACAGQHAYYRDGFKQVGRDLLSEVMAVSPENYLRMMTERINASEQELRNKASAIAKAGEFQQ